MTQNTHPTYKDPKPLGNGKVAVVTGASTGIGEATVRRLRESGWTVYAVARRAERLEELARETGASAAPTDITDQAQVDALRDRVLGEQGTVDAILNISGGARGTDTVADAKDEDWQWMYDVNVMGTLRVVRAFLPTLRANGEGTVLNLTSIAAQRAYEGGAGYNAAKYAERAMTEALRLEEAEHNVRVVEVAPGLVHTPEFSLMRLGGDQAAADKIYAGVEKPLSGQDVAEVCAFAVELPHHVDLDTITVKPVAQAAPHKMIRTNN
ncbi:MULTISPECIES: SDR family oxidoreductase [Kocuria]|uniref:NADP-dependent 3-hydroxy acid dehydrogenase YdfG n=1 Tax=Kocuria marina subsp. indica TaxID=1049583 RepID=A0A1X7DTW5_9MICC|nr:MULTISPECIES: SDR family oxidoreductase [Kocuria]MBN6811802.1 SDR family oxidoreductase [Kocuria indica]MBN6843496.1 SDR family oxidoreductase [Kocuria indica]MCT2360971.1 SDR family oxidoreductase [Kocuria marina]MDT0119819.1 SDR family oxidoreductase [Kocuria sp. PD6]OBA48383.1 oxidoreductase [Kocuria sp. ICS0012]